MNKTAPEMRISVIEYQYCLEMVKTHCDMYAYNNIRYSWH